MTSVEKILPTNLEWLSKHFLIIIIIPTVHHDNFVRLLFRVTNWCIYPQHNKPLMMVIARAASSLQITFNRQSKHLLIATGAHIRHDDYLQWIRSSTCLAWSKSAVVVFARKDERAVTDCPRGVTAAPGAVAAAALLFYDEATDFKLHPQHTVTALTLQWPPNLTSQGPKTSHLWSQVTMSTKRAPSL